MEDKIDKLIEIFKEFAVKGWRGANTDKGTYYSGIPEQNFKELATRLAPQCEGGGSKGDIIRKTRSPIQHFIDWLCDHKEFPNDTALWGFMEEYINQFTMEEYINQLPHPTPRVSGGEIKRNVISDAMDKLAMALVNEKSVDVSTHVDALLRQLNNE